MCLFLRIKNFLKKNSIIKNINELILILYNRLRIFKQRN